MALADMHQHRTKARSGSRPPRGGPSPAGDGAKTARRPRAVFQPASPTGASMQTCAGAAVQTSDRARRTNRAGCGKPAAVAWAPGCSAGSAAVRCVQMIRRSSHAPPLRVLVAGGGVAAIESVLALRSLAGDRVSIELLAPGADFVEKPSSVLHPFAGTAAPRVPLDRLSTLGIARRRGALAAVDGNRHEVHTTDGGRLGYDRLIVATGGRPVDGVPGATTFSGPRSAAWSRPRCAVRASACCSPCLPVAAGRSRSTNWRSSPHASSE